MTKDTFSYNSLPCFLFMARFCLAVAKRYRATVQITEHRETCTLTVQYLVPNKRLHDVLDAGFTAFAYAERD
jgi:hypothetical protein